MHCFLKFFSFSLILILFWTSSVLASPAVTVEPVTNDVMAPQKLIKALRSGGYILYMRHSLSNQAEKDNLVNTFENCSKQRNLSGAGRQQAKSIGKAVRLLNIPIGDVLSSPFCRCKDTARLAFGKFKLDPNLQFSMSKNKKEAKRLADYLYKLMLKTSLDSKNMVLVGHSSNLRDGLGIWPKPEGVIAVFQKRQHKIFYRGMITPADWLQR